MKHFLLFTLAALILAACSAAPDDALLNAKIQMGQTLFNNGTDAAPACTLCHSLQDIVLVGPSLQHVASRAAERVAGQSASDYLRTSITNPTAYLVPGFESGSMNASYAASLSTEQIEALVLFLQTQK